MAQAHMSHMAHDTRHKQSTRYGASVCTTNNAGMRILHDAGMHSSSCATITTRPSKSDVMLRGGQLQYANRLPGSLKKFRITRHLQSKDYLLSSVFGTICIQLSTCIGLQTFEASIPKFCIACTCCSRGVVVSSGNAPKYRPGRLTLKNKSVLALPDEAYVSAPLVVAVSLASAGGGFGCVAARAILPASD